jgi:hypothetical protein
MSRNVYLIFRTREEHGIENPNLQEDGDGEERI